MTPQIPKWTNNALIYHIFPMGFFDCPLVNPIALPNPKLAQIQSTNRLNKIRYYYDYFHKLGINTLYFGPIFESCTHGYDTIDYFQIDRRLGTNHLFFELITELHSQNIKIILDGVFNHTSRLFPAFLDIKKNHKKSKFIDWYKDINFTKNTIWNDGFSYKNWENHTELPELNLENPDVQKFVLKIIDFWQSQYNIDGWRIDVAYSLPLSLLEMINSTSKTVNSNSFIFGELIHENYENFISDKLLDSCTNYQLYNTLIESFNRNNPWQIEAEISAQEEKYKNIQLINFTGNHDTSRLFSQLHDKSKILEIFEFIFTTKGIPCIYYGDEIGLDGEKNSRYDKEVRQSMPYPQNFSKSQQKHLQQILKIISKYS